MLYQHKAIVRTDSFRLIMYTIYRLFDLDYHVYVVRDDVLDLPAAVSNVMLDLLLPKIGFRVISIDVSL